MTKLTPPLKYFGGKQYLADHIIALMPPHTHYVEPFFGSGAVLLHKNPINVSEVVNDINNELINFWTVLQNKTLFAEMQRLLQATPFASEEWYKAETGLSNPTEDSYSLNGGCSVVRATWFFIYCRQSMGGMMETFTPLTRSRTRGGMNAEASAWWNAIEGLPLVYKRLRRVVILNDDALNVITQQDGEGTLFYCDPPYLKTTRVSQEVYKHEMTLEQHYHLLEVLSKIKGKFLLSGYPSEVYSRAAKQHGWRSVLIEIDNKASSKKVKDTKVECVWMNY